MMNRMDGIGPAALAIVLGGLSLTVTGCGGGMQYNSAFGRRGPSVVVIDGNKGEVIGDAFNKAPIAEGSPSRRANATSRVAPVTKMTHRPRVNEPRFTTSRGGGSPKVDATTEPLAAASSTEGPAHSKPVASADPTPANTNTPQAVTGQDPLAGQPTIPTAAPGPRDAVGQLGLFGQLPDTQGQPTSPMDSPENLTQVTFASEGADFDPAVERSGRWLAFASTRHRKTADIYIQRIGGTAVTQLTNDASNDVMPAFSPDGKRVAFASDRAGNWNVYVKDISGGQPVLITDDPTHDLHPSFSPDGKKLVYCSYGAQSGQWEMVVVDLANPAQKRFIGYGLFPEWSPKGDQIVYQRSRERGSRWFSVWTIDLEGDEGVRPTEIAGSSNSAVITPCWSPDGHHIVFCTVVDPHGKTQSRPAKADVWIVAADGTGRATLSDRQFANTQPVWSPDGTIFFVSNRSKGGVENIWSLSPQRAMLAMKPFDPSQPMHPAKKAAATAGVMPKEGSEAATNAATADAGNATNNAVEPLEDDGAVGGPNGGANVGAGRTASVPTGN